MFVFLLLHEATTYPVELEARFDSDFLCSLSEQEDMSFIKDTLSSSIECPWFYITLHAHIWPKP